MFKSILVRADGDETDLPIMGAALSVARIFGAHLTVLHVSIDVDAAAATMASAEYNAGAWFADTVRDLREEADRRLDTAHQHFRKFCTDESLAIADCPGPVGMTASWRTDTGNASDIMGRLGRVHDLIVVSRAQGRDIGWLQSLETTLLKSGRPLLIVPDGIDSVAIDVIAIAWKSTPEAARAVGSAAPFIDRSGHVIVFGVPEHGTLTPDNSPENLAHYLRWRHPNVDTQRVEPKENASASLRDATFDAGADLLVMGAYGHSRLREVVFGGFTQTLLSTAPVPVLMMH